MSELGERVLILDSDREAFETISNFLERWGYRSRQADEIVKIDQQIRDWNPKLIFVDLKFPDSGLLRLREISENPDFAEIPLILTSDDHSEEVAVMGISSGAQDIIYKPLRMAELTIRMEKVLELEKARATMRALNDKLAKERNILARYFSRDFVDQILEEKISPSLGGDRMTASIMFFDLRGSTTIAEKITPEEFSSFLSLMFQDIMDLVFAHKGSVNRLQGDGMLATFGCPVPGDQDALNCARCAVAIREYMVQYNHVRPEYLEDPLKCGMGITTGEIFAGNIGSIQKMEYTVLGDAVNTAARLEGLTKKAGVEILIDGTTREIIGDLAQVRKVQYDQVRGKMQTIDIFALDDIQPG